MSGTGVVSVSGTCVERECVWYWCRECVSGTGVVSGSGTCVESVCLVLV